MGTGIQLLHGAREAVDADADRAGRNAPEAPLDAAPEENRSHDQEEHEQQAAQRTPRDPQVDLRHARAQPAEPLRLGLRLGTWRFGFGLVIGIQVEHFHGVLALCPRRADESCDFKGRA